MNYSKNKKTELLQIFILSLVCAGMILLMACNTDSDNKLNSNTTTSTTTSTTTTTNTTKVTTTTSTVTTTKTTTTSTTTSTTELTEVVTEPEYIEPETEVYVEDTYVETTPVEVETETEPEYIEPETEPYVETEYISDETYYGAFEATYYEGGVGTYGAAGTDLISYYSVASNLFPLGSLIRVEGSGLDGTYRVDDRGGMANNVVDFYYQYGDTPSDFQYYGRMDIEVYLIG